MDMEHEIEIRSKTRSLLRAVMKCKVYISTLKLDFPDVDEARSLTEEELVYRDKYPYENDRYKNTIEHRRRFGDLRGVKFDEKMEDECRVDRAKFDRSEMVYHHKEMKQYARDLKDVMEKENNDTIFREVAYDMLRIMLWDDDREQDRIADLKFRGMVERRVVEYETRERREMAEKHKQMVKNARNLKAVLIKMKDNVKLRRITYDILNVLLSRNFMLFRDELPRGSYY